MMQAVHARSQAVPSAEAETIPNEGTQLARVPRISRFVLSPVPATRDHGL